MSDAEHTDLHHWQAWFEAFHGWAIARRDGEWWAAQRKSGHAFTSDDLADLLIRVALVTTEKPPEAIVDRPDLNRLSHDERVRRLAIELHGLGWSIQQDRDGLWRASGDPVVVTPDYNVAVLRAAQAANLLPEED